MIVGRKLFAICSIFFSACFIIVDSAQTKSSVSKNAQYSNKVLQTCHAVKQKFLDLEIGPGSLVPDRPSDGSDLQICQIKATNHDKTSSCCTRDMEVKYLAAAEMDLRDKISNINNYLKNVVSQNLMQYQERFLGMIELAEQNVDTLLKDIYTIPHDSRRDVIRSFFLDLQEYILKKKVNIHGSVTKFFDELFPLVFQYKLNDPTVTTITDKYSECLIGIRQYIFPQPFGDSPHRLSSSLTKSLLTARSFLDALGVVLKAVNATDQIIMDTECGHALTRLQYCSHCNGYTDDLPCKGFCLNVLRGCMAKVAEFGLEWDELIISLEDLAGSMKGPYSIQDVMHGVDTRVSEAIMHAMENQHRYYEKIIDPTKCGHPATSSPTGVTRPTPASHPPIKPKAPPHNSGWLHSQMETFITTVAEAKGLYNRMPDIICNKSLLYDQNLDSSRCWNGETISQYTKTVPEAAFISQVKFNKEVKISLTRDMKLLALKDELAHLRRTITSHLQEEMQGDWPYASGDGTQDIDNDYNSDYSYPYKGSDADTHYDDEDFYASGSGSGAGSGAGDDEDEDWDGGRRKGGRKPGYNTGDGRGKPNRDQVNVDNIKDHPYKDVKDASSWLRHSYITCIVTISLSLLFSLS